MGADIAIDILTGINSQTLCHNIHVLHAVSSIGVETITLPTQLYESVIYTDLKLIIVLINNGT